LISNSSAKEKKKQKSDHAAYRLARAQGGQRAILGAFNLQRKVPEKVFAQFYFAFEDRLAEGNDSLCQAGTSRITDSQPTTSAAGISFLTWAAGRLKKKKLIGGLPNSRFRG